MNRRAIAILGAIFLLIVGTLGFLIFSRLRSKNAEETPPVAEVKPPEVVDPEPEPEPEPFDQEPIVKLTDDRVVTPVLFYQGDGLTYLNSQGELFQHDFVDNDGKLSLTNRSEVSLPTKTGLQKIYWPQSGNNFIAELASSGARKRWTIYNSETNEYIDMPAQVTSIDWLPEGNKIIYIWLDNENKSTLNIANPDNSEYQTVADIWENDDEIKVSPDGESILFYRTESTDGKNAINVTTPDGSLFRGVIKDGFNFGALWAPDSKRFLFGKRNAVGKYDLWVGDITQGPIKSLGVEALPEKAIWDRGGEFVYAAVPSSQSQSGLSEDVIVRIQATTGEQKQYDLGPGVDAREMFLSSNGDKLFFVNAQDQALYYLDLAK